MTMAISQPDSVHGSLFVGDFSVADILDDYIDNFDSILEDTIYDIVSTARSSLRDAARKLDGWRDIADSLDVEFTDYTFHYTVGFADQSTAHRLEYGDSENAPTGFLRKMADQQSRTLGLQMQVNLEVPSA